MKITVCIKQVPGTAQVEIDPATGVLKRDGVESKMNPYDLYALETALRFKQSHGAEITAVTMGPPQAESVIREAFMMGVDHGAIFSDRRFGGSDVLATAYTLAQGIRAAGGADLVICGKQTTDGDTAQVGAAFRTSRAYRGFMSSAAKKSCSILICRSMWKRCGSSCRAWSASRKEFTSRGCRRSGASSKRPAGRSGPSRSTIWRTRRRNTTGSPAPRPR